MPRDKPHHLKLLPENLPPNTKVEDWVARPMSVLGNNFQQLTYATIMMVDDEPITMEVIQTFLEEAGYRKFILVDQSVQALETLDKKRPDILLLDIVMPEVSGFEILAAVCSNYDLKYLPLVAPTLQLEVPRLATPAATVATQPAAEGGYR